MDQFKIMNRLKSTRLEHLILPLTLSGLGFLFGASLGPLLATSGLIPIAVALPLLGILGMLLGFILGLRLGKHLSGLATSGYSKGLLALILLSAAIPFLISGVRNPTVTAFLSGGVFVLAALFVLLPVRSLSFEAVAAGVVAVASTSAYLETRSLQWLAIAVIWVVATCAVLIRRNRSIA